MIELETLRLAEIEVPKPWFKAGSRVLEIGGGSGFQASVLSSWGCDVVSIDLSNPVPPPPRVFYPVQKYDGTKIPFPDQTFDVIFSSNVLPHVKQLDPSLCEMRRLLKSDGVAIHILPSPAWRFWTSLTYYPFQIKLRVRSIFQSGKAGSNPLIGKVAERRGWGYVLRRILWSDPLGEYPSALSELYYFSRRRWVKVFRSHGFTVHRVLNNGIFYTGHGVLPG